MHLSVHEKYKNFTEVIVQTLEFEGFTVRISRRNSFRVWPRKIWKTALEVPKMIKDDSKLSKLTFILEENFENFG